MTDELPRAPAVARNRDAILEILLEVFKDRSRVLEIGSGTGEHAVYFAPRMDWLQWQTSDRRENHAGISAWIETSGAGNVGAPLDLDVNDPPELTEEYDGVFSANTAHIMSFPEVGRMFAIVAAVLMQGGVFALYGPFNIGGQFTSRSNADFDASLRSGNPAMGIRDLESLEKLGNGLGLERDAVRPMPANNFLVTWIRR